MVRGVSFRILTQSSRDDRNFLYASVKTIARMFIRTLNMSG